MYVHSHWDEKKPSRGWFSFRLSIALFIHPLIEHANNVMARNNSSLSRDGRRRRQNQLALANSHSRTTARSSVCTRSCKIMSRDDSKKQAAAKKKCEKCSNFLARENSDSSRRTEAETRHDLFAFGFARDSSRTSSVDSSARLWKLALRYRFFGFHDEKFKFLLRFVSIPPWQWDCAHAGVSANWKGRAKKIPARWTNRRPKEDEVTPAT